MDIHLSIYPSLCSKVRGFSACRLLGQEGSVGSPSGVCCHPAAIPAFLLADAGGAQLSPWLPALQRSSSREVFFGTGPLAPQPSTGDRRWRGRGGCSRGLPQCLSLAHQLCWHLGASAGSAWTTIPKNPLETAVGYCSSLNEGWNWSSLGRGHHHCHWCTFQAPSSLGLLNQNRHEGSRAAGDLSNYPHSGLRFPAPPNEVQASPTSSGLRGAGSRGGCSC